MRPVPGICKRCGQRYNLSDLKEEYLLGRATGVVVCESCYDESHPQLDTRGLRTNDKQSVPGPQSDIYERVESRSLSGWNPVGADATSTAQTFLGNVRVKI
jgi:hypothetical protein